MSLTVDVNEAAARISEMLAEVEAGREVLIARGTQPIAEREKVAVTANSDPASVIAEIRAARKDFAPITMEGILAWRDEGRR